jgi:hypothetical protein
LLQLAINTDSLPSCCEGGLIFVYSVCGDESSDETHARVFAVAAIFGGETEWDAFNKKWLARTGGKVFHATDCDTDQGDYRDCEHAENKRLYKDLTALLADSRLLGFGSAIDLAGHNEFFPDVPVDVPYYRCFREVVLRCAEWIRMAVPREEAARFIFDSRPESNHNAGVLYDYLVNIPEWKSDVLFEEVVFSHRKPVGVQAADLYAREVMKHLDNDVGPVKRPERLSFTALRKSQRFGCDLIMREYFKDFRRRFDEVAEGAGMRREDYAAWVKRHNVVDNVSSRQRYLIDLEAKEKEQQRGDSQ